MNIEAEEILAAKILQPDSAKILIQEWKAACNKIVFTNGVFDLLHIGHITYLAKAAAEGDKLIIGLNSDNSVKNIKGPERPINDEKSRAIILAALFFVNAVVIFNEDTPLNLIKLLLPDVLIKGADYAIDNIVGGSEVIANGGEVKTINFVDGYSSTAIINKIAGR
jgi:rfaE bifunctional protein nucleotidyltransferase chain/domain